jgi:hypothetical protein
MILDVDKISRLARARKLAEPSTNIEILRARLEEWWSLTYSRPLLDPLLKQYTMAELLYEWFVHYYERPENDPRVKNQKSAHDEKDLEWVRRQIAKNPPQPSVLAPKAKVTGPPTVAPPISPDPIEPPPGPDISARFEG